MSLNNALQIGRSGLLTSQAALQVAGNNMANAATPGYTRRSVHLAPLQSQPLGPNATIGNGVQLNSIRREVDESLQARLRDAISDHNASQIDHQFLSALESVQNELGDNDLSTMLSEFFNAFSELANNPDDNAIRSVVLEQGQSLAGRVQQMRSDYTQIRDNIDRQIGNTVEQVNDLLDQIATLNTEIANLEAGVNDANSLRDKRDLLLDQLAEHMDVTVIEQESGMINVLSGSTPIVLNGESRGVELRKETKNGQLEVSLRVAADGTSLNVQSGTLGALFTQRENNVGPQIEALDTFASQLIFQVNRLHSQGQGKQGYESINGTYGASDTTVNMNASTSGLPFEINNGSFFIHVTNQSTGNRTTHEINVDGDAMSLDDLVNEINTVVGVPNVTAGISATGTLQLDAANGYEMTFSDDTSGALAALGINSYFIGDNATDIAVNQRVIDQPALLAAGADHVPGSNGTALAIATLQDAALEELSGASLRQFWQNNVNQLGVKTSAAKNAVESTQVVRDSLDAQKQSVSGVSLDEEATNLLTFQRQFQAAARFISVVDETIQTLLTLA